MGANDGADGRHAGPDGDESFMHRWSRRKLETTGAATVPEPVGTDQRQSDDHDPAGGSDDPQVRADAVELPPVESLDADSDYSGFLSPEVDEALQRAALRKLFHMPGFNVTDGLDDYAEDFTSFEPLGDLVTHEMKRFQARQDEKEAAARRAEDVSGTGPTEAEAAAEPLRSPEADHDNRPSGAGEADPAPETGQTEDADAD